MNGTRNDPTITRATRPAMMLSTIDSERNWTINCALREPEGQDLPPKPDVEVVDLSVLLAETLGLTGGGDG